MEGRVILWMPAVERGFEISLYMLFLISSNVMICWWRNLVAIDLVMSRVQTL